MITLQLRGNSLRTLSLRREIIQTIPWVDPPIQTAHQHGPEVFYPTRKCWLPSLQVGPIPELGQAQLPLRGSQRDLPAHWHRREQPGPYLSALHPARTGGFGTGEHSWQPPPSGGSGSCSDTYICSRSHTTFGRDSAAAVEFRLPHALHNQPSCPQEVPRMEIITKNRG